MKVFLAFCIGLATPVLAAMPVDEVDTAEIKRLGDTVQHIDGSHRDGPDDEYVRVMGPPADDNHKWFITVIGQKGCAACGRLKADLRRDDYLRSLVTLADGDDLHSDTKSTWAHFNYYLADDKSQQFRWEKIRLTGYPTVLVQPPLNKKYGDPSTVVCQITGYDGDGKKLANAIAGAIKAYLAKQAERRAITRGHRAMPPARYDDDEGDAPGHGQQMPWEPAPKVDPTPSPAPGPGPGPSPNPNDVLPPIFNWPPKPVDATTPAPSAKPDGKIPSTPEALIVYDCQAETTAADESRIQAIVSQLRLVNRILRVRPVDAKDSPVAIPKDQLPAVVITTDGQVTDRISARLLPILAPQPAKEVGIADLPWASILALLTTGFSIPAAIPLAIWGFRFIRARRQAAGKKLLISEEILAWLSANVDPEAIQKFIDQFIKRPTPPATPTP